MLPLLTWHQTLITSHAARVSEAGLIVAFGILHETNPESCTVSNETHSLRQCLACRDVGLGLVMWRRSLAKGDVRVGILVLGTLLLAAGLDYALTIITIMYPIFEANHGVALYTATVVSEIFVLVFTMVALTLFGSVRSDVLGREQLLLLSSFVSSLWNLALSMHALHAARKASLLGKSRICSLAPTTNTAGL